MRRLIYDGDSVYELDEECVSKNKRSIHKKGYREGAASDRIKREQDFRQGSKPGAANSLHSPSKGF